MWSGCGIAAVLVVRREDVRPEAADQPHQRLGRDLRVDQPEAALGQRRLGVALGPAGVDEAEPVLAYAEDLAGGLHLLAPDLGHVLEHVGAVHLRVQDRAALAAGAGDDVDVDALGDVLGGGGGALARLVVGVGVHVHQAEHVVHPRDERIGAVTELRSDALADRYGTASPARRRAVIVVSGVVGVVALAWVAWATWFQSTPDVQSSLRSYDVVDTHSVTTASVLVKPTSRRRLRELPGARLRRRPLGRGRGELQGGRTSRGAIVRTVEHPHRARGHRGGADRVHDRRTSPVRADR